jgi:hypothetical protein
MSRDDGDRVDLRGGAEDAPLRPVTRARSGDGLMVRRAPVTLRVKTGDLVIRRHRGLKTQGTVLRFGDGRDGGGQAWIRWSHPTTLPNPSLEPVDDLEVVEPGDRTDAR